MYLEKSTNEQQRTVTKLPRDGIDVPILKAVILGDSECGKTSFTSRWTNGTFPDPQTLQTTIGASFATKRIEDSNGNGMVLSIWDFGGQMRFIEQLKSMIRGCRIGLLFFDVTHLQSLDNLINYWVPIIEENAGFNFNKDDGSRFILVGNKIDLLDGTFDSIHREMIQFAEDSGTGLQLISAKTGVGIEQLDFKIRELAQKYSN
jgi:small GTP-binding protein